MAIDPTVSDRLIKKYSNLVSSRCLLSIETEALFLGAVLQFQAVLNSLLAVEVKVSCWRMLSVRIEIKRLALLKLVEFQQRELQFLKMPCPVR